MEKCEPFAYTCLDETHLKCMSTNACPHDGLQQQYIFSSTFFLSNNRQLDIFVCLSFCQVINVKKPYPVHIKGPGALAGAEFA